MYLAAETHTSWQVRARSQGAWQVVRRTAKEVERRTSFPAGAVQFVHRMHARPLPRGELEAAKVQGVVLPVIATKGFKHNVSSETRNHSCSMTSQQPPNAHVEHCCRHDTAGSPLSRETHHEVVHRVVACTKRERVVAQAQRSSSCYLECRGTPRKA